MNSHSIKTTHFILDVTATPKFEAKIYRLLLTRLKINLVKIEKEIKNKIIDPSWLELKPWTLSLLICGDKRMQKINQNFRNKNVTTDVLSFPVYPTLRKKRKKDENESLMGDLIISWDKTKRQAQHFNLPLEEEFTHLFFHGVLHLMGYDHEISYKEEKVMEGWEKKLVSKSRLAKKIIF